MARPLPSTISAVCPATTGGGTTGPVSDVELRCALTSTGDQLDGFVTIAEDGTKTTVWCAFGSDIPLAPQPAAGDLLPCVGGTTDQVSYCWAARIDDIDGTPANYVTYYEFVRTTITAAGAYDRTVLGTYTDQQQTATYAPVGVAQLNPCDVGDSFVATNSGDRRIEGPATVTPLANSTYLHSLSALALGGDVEVVDQFGNDSVIVQDLIKQWQNEDDLPLAPPTFTVPAGASLLIWWTEPGL